MFRIALLLVLSLLAGSCNKPQPVSVSATPGVKTAYQAFPSGFRYMQENEALSKAVQAGNRAVVRSHGWYLWAGIMQSAKGLDWPVWYTWPNTKAAFASEPATNQLQAGAGRSSRSLLARNAANRIDVNVSTPGYPIPGQVLRSYPDAVCVQGKETFICDGEHFLFNGDILIPTESLSNEAMEWIRNGDQPLYRQATLDALHGKKVHTVDAPPRHIVTKHMYWPVKANGVSAIPVWRNDFGPADKKYAGYEMWKHLIAIDPSGKLVGKTTRVTYLHGVTAVGSTKPLGPRSAMATVYALNDFYYHKLTQEDWNEFDDADKAILNASSYWAYNQPFGPGDYLVTVAMHVNTKEIPTWALQSVWWSDQPGQGPWAANRPDIPAAVGPWKHYLLVDSYGIPATRAGSLPVAMNPYIELAIHPVATNCQNCHHRAGWPRGTSSGKASYQNPDCPSLLEPLNPDSGCLKNLLLTDLQWIIPDRAIAP